MLKRIIRSATFYLGSTLYLMYTTEELKRRINRFAETETVYNEKQYVLVRLARGDYNSLDGPEQMVYDYKFYKTIKPRV